MKINIKCGLILFLCVLSAGYALAADLDISIREILFPKKIYFNQRNNVYLYLKNNSGSDMENCTIAVEADDGSKISQVFTLDKNGQKVELKWVPQRQGKMQFKAVLTLPKGSKEKNTENNQVIETIEVLSKLSK